jgi:hypothetical protein
MRVLTMTGVALLVSAGAFGQDLVAQKQAIEVATRVPFEKAVTGAPYSAETLIEGLQVLADGNRIVRKTTGRVYRDGEGRTRREEDQPGGKMFISIVDPVGGYTYSLDPESKTAWRTPTGTAAGILEKLQVVEQQQKQTAEQLEAQKAAGGGGEVRARSGGAGGGGGEVMMRTRGGEPMAAYAVTPAPLEHKTLDGIAVEGRKTSRTIPAGKVGNEQPLTVVSEEWRSPELNVLVMTRNSDPRTGESSYRLTNIIRAEPDRSLFVVPPDYTVKDSGVRRMLEAKK